MKQLMLKIKEEDQDFEFYPTTKEMINVVYRDIKDNMNGKSILDIGAGNGNIFKVIEDLIPEPKDKYDHKPYINKYAIEKSEILINDMASDVMILGTDFHQQTLIDKKVDIIFCNPPYKEYRQWMLKILNECNCELLYFVVPERWIDDKQIVKSLNGRFFSEEEEQNYNILWKGDFLDSEYRQARAKVHIIKIDLSDRHSKTDPFNNWFDSHFNINADKSDDEDFAEAQTTREKLHEIIKGRNIIEALEELYQKDFEKLLNTYKQLEKLDHSIFEELNVNLSNLKESLKIKIEGLKNLYWKELFDNLDKITERLTSKSREKMLSKLMEHTHIDFTCSNAYALVIWVLKNANQYIDDQLKEIYLDMSSKENIKNYKSNKVFLKDDWRYAVKDHTHFKLDYRLVFTRHYCFDSSSYGRYDFPKGLARSAHDFLNDIITIAKNLGFNVRGNSYSFEWSPGKEKIFYMSDDEEFMRIRAFKNGNIHCKPNQEFIMKLNIEAARLNGWVKDQTDTAKELDLNIADVMKYYKSNIKLVKSNIKLLLK